jgi:hypothetical protein
MEDNGEEVRNMEDNGEEVRKGFIRRRHDNNPSRRATPLYGVHPRCLKGRLTALLPTDVPPVCFSRAKK